MSRVDAPKKEYDFERDIVPMCARLDGADLSQLRRILQSLVMEGKITAIDANTVGRWNQARTCEALQKYFIGLAVPEEDVDDMHALAIQFNTMQLSSNPVIEEENLNDDASSSSGVATRRDDLNKVFGGFPNAMDRFLTRDEMGQLSKATKQTRAGADRVHAQCHASTKQGTQCMKKFQQGLKEGAKCFNYCQAHLYKIFDPLLTFTQAPTWGGTVLEAQMVPESSMDCNWSLNGPNGLVFGLAIHCHPRDLLWHEMLLEEFVTSVAHVAAPASRSVGGERHMFAYFPNLNRPDLAKILAQFMLHFGSHLTGVREHPIDPNVGRAGAARWSDASFAVVQRIWFAIFEKLQLPQVPVRQV